MRQFITGNEAVVQGALRAGCDFVAGYPITPASSILNDMIRAFDRGCGIAVQTEDEIAAIGQCIAAAMCGARAMTATSGPGLSLYSENIGLAQMIEAPLVIVNSQRMGPATGGATATGEGDVMFARYVTAGGYPLPVLAAADAASAYRLTYRAFQIAEDLRTPVIVLLSKDVSITRQTVDLAAVPLAPIRGRQEVPIGQAFEPYAFSAPEDIPAFVPIGGPRRVRVTGSIHDACGLLTTSPAEIERKLTHLNQKIEAARERLEDVDADLDPAAETLFISYGLSDGAVREAVDQLRATGLKVSRLTLYSLWPVPVGAIRRAAGPSVLRVVVPELNVGLYVDVVRGTLPNLQIESIVRYDGGRISPTALIDQVRTGVAVAPIRRGGTP